MRSECSVACSTVGWIHRSSKQHAVHCRSSSRLLDFIRQSALRRLTNITVLHARLPARAMRCIADAAHNIRM
jgi:hypothetical protein